MNKAFASVASHKRDSVTASFVARLKRLSDHETLSRDAAKKYDDGVIAIRHRSGLRMYGWYTHVDDKRSFVASHVILKKTDKLDPKDIRRVERNRSLFEENKL